MNGENVARSAYRPTTPGMRAILWVGAVLVTTAQASPDKSTFAVRSTPRRPDTGPARLILGAVGLLGARASAPG